MQDDTNHIHTALLAPCCQFITHNIFSSWPLSPLSGCVYIEGNVPLLELSVSSPRRQTPWYFQEKYAAPANARDSCPCVWHVSLCVRLCVRHCLCTPLLSLARQWPFTTKCHSGQYVRKTFGTGGRKEGWLNRELKPKDGGEWQGNNGGCADGSRTKGTMCAQSEQVRGRLAARTCVFLQHNDARVRRMAGGEVEGAVWTVTLQGSPGESECHDLLR